MSRQRQQKPPEASGQRVVVLAHEGLSLFEFSVATEVFGLRREEFDSWYEFKTASVDPLPVRATGGVRLSVDGGLRLLDQATTIIVPGWKGTEVEVPRALGRALRRAFERGARLVSFCSGAFALAGAGLLDGRRATTHWRYAGTLAARFPAVRVEPDVLYVDEGQILTSAGSAAAIDLSLHLVRSDYGPEAANIVARRLVVPPHRDGGQAQFIRTSVDEAAEGSTFGPFIDWARQNLQDDLSVAVMAAQVGMSERNFARQFRARVGMTPGAWVTHQRVLSAQSLLEADALSVDEVARLSGFQSTPTFRHHFSRQVGLSPTKYRQRFRT